MKRKGEERTTPATNMVPMFFFKKMKIYCTA